LGLLITLIASVATSVIGGFTTVPYIGGGAQMLNSLIECAAIAGTIIEFIAIIKLRKADDMPELAKQGAHCIFINYIISWAVAAIGTIIMIFAAVALAFSVVDELDDADYNDSEVGGLLAGIDDYYDYDEYDDYEEYDEIEVYEESFDISSPGFWDSLTEEFADDEANELLDALDDAEGAWIAFIVALLIMIGGGIVAMYYYYRGWWLISKSELPVLPEPIEEEVGEEVVYEEVENVEVVENEQ
jgi:hypothetical protein